MSSLYTFRAGQQKALSFVLDRLQAPNLSAIEQQRAAADLAHAFGELVSGAEDFGRLLVKHQMIGRKCGPLTCQWKFLVLR